MHSLIQFAYMSKTLSPEEFLYNMLGLGGVGLHFWLIKSTGDYCDYEEKQENAYQQRFNKKLASLKSNNDKRKFINDKREEIKSKFLPLTIFFLISISILVALNIASVKLNNDAFSPLSLAPLVILPMMLFRSKILDFLDNLVKLDLDFGEIICEERREKLKELPLGKLWQQAEETSKSVAGVKISAFCRTIRIKSHKNNFLEVFDAVSILTIINAYLSYFILIPGNAGFGKVYFSITGIITFLILYNHKRESSDITFDLNSNTISGYSLYVTGIDSYRKKFNISITDFEKLQAYKIISHKDKSFQNLTLHLYTAYKLPVDLGCFYDKNTFFLFEIISELLNRKADTLAEFKALRENNDELSGFAVASLDNSEYSQLKQDLIEKAKQEKRALRQKRE